MSGFLLGFLLILGGLLLLAAMLVLTPVKLGLTLQAGPKTQLRIALRLLGGLTPSIPIRDTTRRQRKTAAPTTEKKAEKSRSRRRSRRSSARAVRVATSMPQLVIGLLRPIHLVRLDVDADIGLEDPADTGHLFGLIAALTSSLQASRRVSIAVRPVFATPSLRGELDADLSVVPAALIPPAARFAWRVYGPNR